MSGLNHKKIVDEIINNTYGSRKNLEDIVVHTLRHMGIYGEDLNKCKEEIRNWLKEN